MPTAAGLYYALFESGQKDQPPVILLHGAGSSHLVWPSALRRLAGQRVIALDLPGHGRSPGFGMQSIAAYAERVMEFLNDQKLYQVVLVGHSMGGAIALDLALNHPDYVVGLSLIASGAYLGVADDLLDAFSNSFTLSNAFHIFQQRAFSSSAAPVLIERCMAAMKEVRPSVLAADWQASARFDLRPLVGQINAPAWVMTGADDRLTPPAYAHFLAGHMPAARLQIIPNAGHMLLLEQPERAAQGLQQFLGALASARYAGARMSPAATPAPVEPRPSTRIDPFKS